MKAFALAVAILSSGVLAGPTAQADGHFRGRVGVSWNQGRWVHDRYHGRLGWWWVVGPRWHYYPRPQTYVVESAPETVIVQQTPPVVVQQPTPPAAAAAAPIIPVIYYCKATGTNYPETMSCPGGWSKMTADTPPQP
jgi:hypothetical protein